MTTASTDDAIMHLIEVHDVVEANVIFWKQKNLSSLQICKNFMQFQVHFLNRRYEITNEDVENIDDILACKIFNSEISYKKLCDKSYKQFIMLYFNKAFEFNRLDRIIECTRKLITSFLENRDISEDDEIQENCCVLTSLFLEPMASYWIRNDDTLDMNLSDTLVELNVMIPQAFEAFTHIVSSGVIYRNISVYVVTEYCMVFEKNPKLFIKMLQEGYSRFLEINNYIVLTVAIKSLTNLCAITSIKRDLLTSFQAFSEILYHIACEKHDANFCAVIIHFFNRIAELDRSRKIFTATQRLEIYKCNIVEFSYHSATMKGLFRMIKLNEHSLLKTIIDVLNSSFASKKDVKIIVDHLISSREVTIASIVEFITKTASDSPRCIRACQIFTYVYTTVLTINEEFVGEIHEVLTKCFINEQAFGMICEFITTVDNDFLKKLLEKNPKVLTQTLERAIHGFKRFQYPKVLAQIIQLLKCLKQLMPVLSKTLLEQTISQLYEELIEIEALEIAEIESNKCIESPIMKLTLMFEAEIVFFQDYFEYDALFAINRRHLENDYDTLYSHFARFQTVLLKFSFDLIVKRKREAQNLRFPVTLEDVISMVSDLRHKLTTLVKKQVLFENVYEAKQILTSIFDTFAAFHVRPVMIDGSKGVLSVRQPSVDKATFKAIMESVELNIYIYQEETSSTTNRLHKYNDFNFSRKILNSLLDFFKNYFHNFDCTPAFKIISLLHEDNFHNSIVNILKFLQLNPDFVKIVALAIMVFVVEEDRNVDFPVFSFSLNEFLIDHGLQQARFNIVEFILTQLSALFKRVANSNNRLLVLKNIQIFMPILNEDQLKLAKIRVMMATKDLQLTKVEKDTLVEFLKKYNSGVVIQK